VGAIHRCGDLEPVPVDRGWLGKVVGQANLQDVADSSLERRPRHLTVESPRARYLSRHKLPVDLACYEIDLDDGATRRRYCRLDGVGVANRDIRGHPVDDRPVTAMSVYMSAVIVGVVVVADMMGVRLFRHENLCQRWDDCSRGAQAATIPVRILCLGSWS